MTVPYGADIVLDVSPPSLAGLQIDGSLSFARQDLHLRADWIVVHGALSIGTKEQPFLEKATITLTGSDTAQNIMGMGTKVLGVMGGTLEMFGRRERGWTRLGATAEAGDTKITLQGPVPWDVGDEIVIASTGYWRSHDEERTITKLSGATLELDQPLSRQHWGVIQTFDGRPVDERAEVGLLTRNVKVQGDESSARRASEVTR